MTGLNYVTRRGAIYVWRRRLPAWVSQTSYLQISLRTPKFSTAKILANLVNAGFALCKLSSLRLLAEAEALERFDRRNVGATTLNWGNTSSEALKIPVMPAPSHEKEKQRYSDLVTSIVADYVASRDRVIDDPAEQKKIAKDVTQQRAILSQFAEATKVEKLTDMRQEDLYYYVSVLERLPKIYRKDEAAAAAMALVAGCLR